MQSFLLLPFFTVAVKDKLETFDAAERQAQTQQHFFLMRFVFIAGVDALNRCLLHLAFSRGHFFMPR